ncbi:pre-rRNA-processing protein esf1 [Dipsacomyces acuminosporus]|nr:pre-rRNA-processing protein esf1 [Dipsacomyces acuminosporus]
MAGQKNSKSESAKRVTQDSRFSHVQEDPRFIRPKKNYSKVKVDKRFTHMIKDKDFTETSKVDRYGRVREDNRIKAQLRSTYDFGSSESNSEEESDGEEEESSEVEGEESKSESEAESESESASVSEDEDEDEDEAPIHVDRARGEGVGSESESESDSDISDIDWGKFGSGQNGGLSDIEEDPDTIPRGDETKRFACVNMDWEHVRAVDLLTVFSAFKPDGGSIVSVKIYPSEFGKERIANEAINGPPREIFGESNDKHKTQKDGGLSDESSDDDDDEEVDLIKEQVEDNEEFDQVALRKYELEKMRYYFAVIECDSVETARAVYNHCDGTEYEASANFFDLRFIPGDMEFDDSPKDEAFHVPEKYEPLDFSTQALQHSKVKLTWDADEPSRMKVTRRAFTQDEVDNMDFGHLLASSSGESSDEEDRINKRNLLLSGLGRSGDGSGSDEDEGNGDQEMEITFTPGLSEAAASRLESKKTEEEKSHADETTIDRFRRIKKERRDKWKESKKTKKRDANDLISDSELDAATAADPFFTYSDGEEEQAMAGVAPKPRSKMANGSGKKEGKLTRKQREEAEAKERAELELLLDGAESGRKHFDMAEIIKAEKNKGKKKKGKRSGVEVEDDFKLNTSDPRFSALFDSHNFAIDPNNPNFKKTKAMKELLSESRKRHKKSFD